MNRVASTRARRSAEPRRSLRASFPMSESWRIRVQHMALLVAQIARACERHEERDTCVGGHVVGRFKVTGVNARAVPRRAARRAHEAGGVRACGVSAGGGASAVCCVARKRSRVVSTCMHRAGAVPLSCCREGGGVRASGMREPMGGCAAARAARASCAPSRRRRS